MKPQHAKEPWTFIYGNLDIHQTMDPLRYDSVSRIAATNALRPEAAHNAKRITQCVNACAGIENPEEAIQEAREALAAMLQHYAPASFDTVKHGNEDALRHEVKIAHAALSKLAGEQKEKEETPVIAPQFPELSCSECGMAFPSGPHGFRHCENHKGKASKP